MTERWMLTPLCQRELKRMLDFPVGLNRPRPILLVKAPKEVILTAKIRRGFKVYVVPMKWQGTTTAALVSAFFDDPDEPLALYSPLLGEERSEALRAGLLSGEFDVHFFDELNYELLGYVASVTVPEPAAAALTTDREEIADVIVVTNSRVLFIQAKDSPNNENILNNALRRKKATARKSLAKAVAQATGAARYVRSRRALEMLVGGELITIATEDKRLYSLIVLKEMFNDQYEEYSAALLKLFDATGVPGIALDYPELNMYTAHLVGESAFFEAFERVFHFGLEHGSFPRLRLRPPDSNETRS